MSPRSRLILTASAAALIAIWVGAQVAGGQFWLGLLLTGLIGILLVEWSGRVATEALILSGLLLGYLIGNRGFAQISLAPGLPLLAGEVGLGACLALLLARGAARRHLPWRTDSLGIALLLWAGLSLRIIWDVKTYGFMAVRDFAMIYYALFFFIARALYSEANHRALLRRTLIFAAWTLPVVGVTYRLFPEFFQSVLVWRGNPVIFFKGDLLGTFLFALFVWIAPLRRDGRALDWIPALMCLVGGLAALSRAGLVGLGVALGIYMLARNWRPFVAVATIGIIGGIGLGAMAVIERTDVQQTKVYAVYEHLAGIFDLAGTRHYVNQESADTGDNNRFRLVWWRNVTNETLRNGPAFGLGFGYDLTAGFQQEYYPDKSEEMTVRSPHSIVFTVFGRMGVAGLLAFIAIVAVMARRTLLATRAVRAGGDPSALRLYAAAWTILSSAAFGVVLEGPMGAILFWTFLGAAVAFAENESPVAADPSSGDPLERSGEKPHPTPSPLPASAIRSS